MRVVLDTNVLVAAFATRGLCAEVLEVCLTNHTIVLSEHILSEVAEKLTGKLQLPHDISKEIIYYLREQADIVHPEKIRESVCRDSDDIQIVGTALGGKVKFLITGDEDLLILKQYKSIEIVTPREFWNRLQ